MILTDSTVTRVVAGAGSGKSSTLVLRVIAMHVYRRVPLQRLRVVTFTRNSRADFINKLREVAAVWDVEISATEASAIVRTFHSLLFAQAKAAGLNVRTLDQLEGASKGGDAASPFPTLVVDGDSDLAKLLVDTANRLLSSDPAFGDLVASLYRHSFVAVGGIPLDDAKTGRILAVKANDYVRTRYLEQLWRTEVAPDLMSNSLIDFSPASFMTGPSEVDGRPVEAHGPWWANAFIPQLDAWLMLGVPERYGRGRKTPDGFPLSHAVGAKKACVNVLTSNAHVVWVNSSEDLAALHLCLKWQSARDRSFPKFGVKLTGEVASTPLLIAFWQQAQFIQSLGLEVVGAASDAADSLIGVDALFSRALARFWPAFVREVHGQGYTLSNEVFTSLSDERLLRQLPDSAILGIQHLLIDEFQDISGIIVKWIQAVRVEVERRGHRSSIMVVGDDWQSIYGWRGASPKFFTDFFDYFRTASSQVHGDVTLCENFRSSQAIVDAASEAIALVRDKVEKRTVAKGRHAALTDPVELVRLPDTSDLSEAFIHQFVSRDSVYVIARTRSSLESFKDLRAPALTIHGAKGLEADYVLMVDDFAPPHIYPLRARWYARAGLGSYDDAQTDEAMRLAYVAMTRARKGCCWVIRAEASNSIFARLENCGSSSLSVREVADE